MTRSARQIDEQTPWQELTPGGEIYEPGTARAVKTGDWRTNTPVWLQDQCRQCLLCAPWCPDSSIPVGETGRRADFDYMHCKGCGICARVCPFGAIQMREGSR